MSSPISGFTAIPNPYMIPLLFLQSLLIGAGFGIGYQGERRKLSAMSNEDFNKLDLGLHAFNQFKEILARNDFGKMLDLMHPLTQQLADAFGQFLNSLPENIGRVANEATGGLNLFASTGLVGAAGSSGNVPQEQFETYLKFLAKLKQPDKQFTGPAQNPPSYSTGPIGPFQPTTGQDYNSMQLEHLLRIDPRTLSTVDKARFAQAVKDKTPTKLSPQEILEKSTQTIAEITATSQIKQIAIYHALVTRALAQYKKDNKRSIFIKSIAEYNRVVAGFGKTNLMYDTAKSYLSKSLVPRN